MTSLLLSSPSEILKIIFAHLEPTDHLTLGLTHRNLRPLINPILYSRIEWEWKGPWTPPILRFLRSIIHRPELAKFVKVVILKGSNLEYHLRGDRSQSPKIAVTEDDLKPLIECVARTNVSYRGEWIQELRSGTIDAFVALLLSQVPRLNTLYLGEDFTLQSLFVGRILRSSLCEKHDYFHSFQNLREVSMPYFHFEFDKEHFRTTRNTADVLPLFYLPTVERMRAVIDNPAYFEWPGACFPASQSLRSLDLTMVREGNLGKILSATPKLKSLTWDWYYSPDLHDDFHTDIIDLDQLAADVTLVRETLTYLKISASTDVVEITRLPDTQIKGSFTLFPGLTRLKTLEVPIPFLFGFSKSDPNILGLEKLLPTSLEWLHLTDDLSYHSDWNWMRDVDYLLSLISSWILQGKQFTPYLGGIRLILKQTLVDHWTEEADPKFKYLGMQAAQAGLQFEVIEVLPSPESPEFWS